MITSKNNVVEGVIIVAGGADKQCKTIYIMPLSPPRRSAA